MYFSRVVVGLFGILALFAVLAQGSVLREGSADNADNVDNTDYDAEATGDVNSSTEVNDPPNPSDTAILSFGLTKFDWKQIFESNNSTGRTWYGLATCDYRTQAGYTCRSCSQALHCIAPSFALMANCHGLRPYCYHGHCSSVQDTKCVDKETAADGLKLTTVPTVQAVTDIKLDEVTEGVAVAESTQIKN